jgi:hypothetical protein
MNRIHTHIVSLVSLFAVAFTGLFVTACDGDVDSHEDIVKRDLLTIIDSLGSPCGQVLNYESMEELGYTVHCSSGDQYFISVNPQGRVDIQNRE